MAFCPNCGSHVEGKFCAKCGATATPSGGPPPTAAPGPAPGAGFGAPPPPPAYTPAPPPPPAYGSAPGRTPTAFEQPSPSPYGAPPAPPSYGPTPGAPPQQYGGPPPTYNPAGTPPPYGTPAPSYGAPPPTPQPQQYGSPPTQQPPWGAPQQPSSQQPYGAPQQQPYGAPGTGQQYGSQPPYGTPQGDQQQPYGYPQPVAGSGGLTENVANALCYSLGFITGIVFLVLEPYNRNRNTKFHAFQSIFVFGAIFAIYLVVFEILTRILLRAALETGTGFSLFRLWGILYDVFWVASLGVWLFLMYKAYMNQKFVVPIVGPIAEKQANS